MWIMKVACSSITKANNSKQSASYTAQWLSPTGLGGGKMTHWYVCVSVGIDVTVCAQMSQRTFKKMSGTFPSIFFIFVFMSNHKVFMW